MMRGGRAMASLTIMRDSGYADRARKYKVVIDGAVAGHISNGETKEFAVSPGHHRLCMKVDWCGSKPIEFTVTERDTVTFQAKSNLRGSKIFAGIWYVIFDRDSYILLERSSP
jgi:hypothetical protein